MASFATNIQNVVTLIAGDYKAVNAKIGSLNSLTTTAKSDLVAAINEVRSSAASATGINDSATSTSSTWSSSKIAGAISAATPTWSSITGKPSTFDPTIGTTATTAKAGNYVPAWSEVTGKPTFAAVATSGSYADLTGTVPTSALPPLAVTDVSTVASQAAMLALTAQRGDVAIRTDNGKTYILASDSPSTLADWKEITSAGAVVSVAGKTGTVVLTKADVGLSNVDNTSDLNKPISTATQAALNTKAVIGTTSGTAADAGLIGDTTIDFVSVYNAAKA